MRLWLRILTMPLNKERSQKLMEEIKPDYTNRLFLNAEEIREISNLKIVTVENGITFQNGEGKILLFVPWEEVHMNTKQLSFFVDMANFGINTSKELANKAALVS